MTTRGLVALTAACAETVSLDGVTGAVTTGATGAAGIAIGSEIERTDGLVAWATATSVCSVAGALSARGGSSLNDFELALAAVEGNAGPATTDKSPVAIFCGNAVARFCGKAIIALRRANSSAARFARRRARYRRHQARER